VAAGKAGNPAALTDSVRISPEPGQRLHITIGLLIAASGLL
jgi:hypothetical protein